MCGRNWAKQIAQRKKEREAKAEQASWQVPVWPMWTPPKGGSNQGNKGRLAGFAGSYAEGLDEGGK